MNSKSITMSQFSANNRVIKISGNMHTLEQLDKRKVQGNKVVSMVKASIAKMEIQKTYAIISGNDKLLVLRINQVKVFVITVLIDKMQLKRNKAIILNVNQDTI